MNYFEIINKVLIELNYDSVSSFADLTRLEHKRLMNIINRLNKEICNLNDKFHFRQMIKEIKLSEDRIEYSLNISGKIMRVLGEQGEYSYHSDYTDFYSSNPPMNAFCAYGIICHKKLKMSVKIF